MSCQNISYDNRESCTNIVPSSCSPYTGYISELIKDKLPCRPNVNDIIKSITELIEELKKNTGILSTLDKKCLNIDVSKVTQSELNQSFINTLCSLKDKVENLNLTFDPNTTMLVVDLLCLTETSCAPKDKYSLQEIIEKLLVKYCNLENRLKRIETLLNI